jgi:segregation and condensation protein B
MPESEDNPPTQSDTAPPEAETPQDAGPGEPLDRQDVPEENPEQVPEPDALDAEDGPDDALDDAARAEIAATVEAILFATDNPLSEAKIAQVAELPGRRAVKEAIRTLNQRYEQMGCAFTIERIAGGFQMLTREQYHDVLARLLRVKSESKLSQAAMETLAVVAYRQPIMRADVESIRGVACGDMIRKLMEKNLVKIVGRAEVLGRPMLYGTTQRFLEVFGLNSLDDLPNVEELRGGQDRPEPESKPGTETEAAEAGAEPEAETAATDSPQPPQPEAAETQDSAGQTESAEAADRQDTTDQAGADAEDSEARRGEYLPDSAASGTDPDDHDTDNAEPEKRDSDTDDDTDEPDPV